jgi:hypothetical protein
MNESCQLLRPISYKSVLPADTVAVIYCKTAHTPGTMLDPGVSEKGKIILP